ncbi:tyrosine-protein phosphatase non-receptor type 1-like [Megalops cyprinoides]|uniref:tyrosine-protein phosphatase non-receptor type 1-like n=1 Tax=Megalops cyprinoides TaxID=118141 RepID=UPI0018645D7E|nr:tyrosine-protein phosphatase non-receptor type 1-like [Megalops cyprinoides]
MSTTVEAEFQEIDEAGYWNTFYQEICLLSSELPFKHAKLPENKGRNRYKDVSPFDHSRIRLQLGTNDYINASLIPMKEAGRSYILTQGPLPTTCGHFWEMVWEQRSRGVVMLNRIIELGSVKCAQYWPRPLDRELIFGDTCFRVTLISEDVKSYCTVRQLELENLLTEETREILHFHYTAWPDFGVPESPSSFLNFLFKVRESGCLSPDQGPVVVHCSAGIGRSGTFCLVDTCLLLMSTQEDPSSVSVSDVLLEMRQYRMGLIQTAHQLRFSYLAVIEGAKSILGNASAQEAWKDHSDEEDILPMFTPPLPPPSPLPRPPKHIGVDSQNNRAEFLPFPDVKEELLIMRDSGFHIHSSHPEPELRRRNEPPVPLALPVSVPGDQPDSPSGHRRQRAEGQVTAPQQQREGKAEEEAKIPLGPLTTMLANVYLCTALALGAYICYRACFH